MTIHTYIHTYYHGVKQGEGKGNQKPTEEIRQAEEAFKVGVASGTLKAVGKMECFSVRYWLDRLKVS